MELVCQPFIAGVAFSAIFTNLLIAFVIQRGIRATNASPTQVQVHLLILAFSDFRLAINLDHKQTYTLRKYTLVQSVNNVIFVIFGIR